MELNTVDTQWKDDQIIDLVRKHRNDLIKDFLDERHLKEYIGNEFRMRELSKVKIEFIRHDLKELLISPVNINLYEPLISHIRLANDATLIETEEQLFYQDLGMIFKRHIYQ